MTVANLVLLVAIAIGSWFYFFMVGARPDGVKPGWYLWFGVLWFLGPIWSVGTLITSAIKLKKCWLTWVNVAITAAYVMLWGIALVG